jgi:hypothetical protein
MTDISAPTTSTGKVICPTHGTPCRRFNLKGEVVEVCPQCLRDAFFARQGPSTPPAPQRSVSEKRVSGVIETCPNPKCGAPGRSLGISRPGDELERWFCPTCGRQCKSTEYRPPVTT